MCDRDISSHSITVPSKKEPKKITPKEDIAIGRQIAASMQKDNPDEPDGKYQVLKRTR